MQKPWGVPAIFGDGEHQGHMARFWNLIQDWAWCDDCSLWEHASPDQEVR